MTKKLDLFYTKSELVTDDNPWKLFSTPQERELFEFNDRHQHDEPFNPEQGSYVDIYIRSDPTKRVYNRSVRSMLAFFGSMGGLIRIVSLFFTGLISSIVNRNFTAALISDTYKVQKYNRD